MGGTALTVGGTAPVGETAPVGQTVGKWCRATRGTAGSVGWADIDARSGGESGDLGGGAG